MAKSLQEYVEWLDERELIWPKPPAIVDAKATAYLKPIKGIKAVVWDIYGTLLRISDGEIVFDVEDELRMQVAMDKTIREFNMWQSMTRKPGDPWKQMYEQYKELLREQQLSGTRKKGDTPEIDASLIWRVLLKRLADKDFNYEVNSYGDAEEFSDKVTYFFQANLQGVEAAPHALEALKTISSLGLKNSLLANAQPFSIVQLLRALREQGVVPPLSDLLSLDCLALSFQERVRKPSVTLFEFCLECLAEYEIAPKQVLYVGSRLRHDLTIAKSMGIRTVLYAADKIGLRAKKEDMKDPNLKPDRLITDLSQVRDILAM